MQEPGRPTNPASLWHSYERLLIRCSQLEQEITALRTSQAKRQVVASTSVETQTTNILLAEAEVQTYCAPVLDFASQTDIEFISTISTKDEEVQIDMVQKPLPITTASEQLLQSQQLLQPTQLQTPQSLQSPEPPSHPTQPLESQTPISPQPRSQLREELTVKQSASEVPVCISIL